MSIKVTFDSETVAKVLSKLPNDSAPGPDGIPPIVLKNCASALVDPLSFIMQQSYDTGEVPAEWKHSIVVPIYKKGDKLCAANYRPISLTSIACKCMEKILVEHIRAFLKQENLILDEQHGFTPGRSTITNMLLCLNNWTKEHDAHNSIDIFYTDFEKAFDRTAVMRLLVKLECMGFRGKFLAWLRGFLLGRKFQVRVGDALSEIRPVLSGVPQGSVLSPLLFALYIIDLKQVILSKSSFFADDAKFFGNPDLNYAQLQEDLDRINDWCKEWLLSLNVDKCFVMHIGVRNPNKQYVLDGTPIKSVTTQRDLGILVSNNLKWEPHITNVAKKGNSMLYIVKKTFQYLSPETFLKIYKSYLRPILEYGFQIWSPYFVKDIELLERVQRRATKLPQGYKRLPYEERLKRLGLTSLKARRERGDLIETFKIMNGYYDCKEIFQDFFTLSQNTNLRGHSLKLSTSRSSMNPRSHFLCNRVVSAWNSLPQSVIDAVSVNNFKNKLDDFLKQRI